MIPTTHGPSLGPAYEEELRATALISARLGGCTCRPEITLVPLRGRVWYVFVAHDGWCGHPSMRKGADA